MLNSVEAHLNREGNLLIQQLPYFFIRRSRHRSVLEHLNYTQQREKVLSELLRTKTIEKHRFDLNKKRRKIQKEIEEFSFHKFQFTTKSESLISSVLLRRKTTEIINPTITSLLSIIEYRFLKTQNSILSELKLNLNGTWASQPASWKPTPTQC